MPQGCIPLLLILILLVLLSGFFSATETAYSCLNKLKLKSMINDGDLKAQKVYELSEKFESLITTILIGNNIVNLSAASISAVFFAKLITNGVDSSVVSTVVLTVVILIFGEITPKFLAKSCPEKMAFALYPVIMLFYYILFPLNIIFTGYQKLIAKIFRVKKEDVITDNELITMVNEAEEDGVLEEDASNLVRSALEFSDSEAGDILVPRVKIVAASVTASMEEVRGKFTDSGFSRLIIYKDSIDDVLGFIHEKDFYRAYLNNESDISGILNKLFSASEHMKISVLLKKLQEEKCQIAAVYDEYGGLLGIVSVEDILEELVGEIWDEHDKEDQTLRKINDNEYIVAGNCDIDTFFDELNIKTKESEEPDSNTIGGWLTEQCEHIPKTGECVDWNDLSMEILNASDKQVLEVKITKKTEAEEKDDKDKTKDKDKSKEKST